MRRLVLAAGVFLATAMVPLPSSAATTTSTFREGAAPVQTVDHRPGHRSRDCHRDVRRHYLPGYGRILHRHVGPRCRVDRVRERDRRWDRDRGRDRDRDCIRIGDVRVCT